MKKKKETHQIQDGDATVTTGAASAIFIWGSKVIRGNQNRQGTKRQSKSHPINLLKTPNCIKKNTHIA